MISQSTEYALRAMSLLACHLEVPITAKELGQRTHVPVDYLSKILQQLTKAGLIKAHRGQKGGFKLAYAPEVISLLMIVNAIDPIERILSCPLKNPLHDKQLCPLHRRLDQALENMENMFKSCSLANLADFKYGHHPLCQIEHPCKTILNRKTQ